MENQSNLKWYQKTSGVIVLLILFFPVGLYLMWKNDLWTKKTRWIVTSVIALFVIANAKNNSNVDPCKCSEVGANAQMIGYNNLSMESKEIFDACESKYSSPADAYEDCVNKVSNEIK